MKIDRSNVMTVGASFLLYYWLLYRHRPTGKRIDRLILICPGEILAEPPRPAPQFLLVAFDLSKSFIHRMECRFNR